MPEFVHAGQRVILSSSTDMSAVPDGSVDFFVTSPPYWNLKDYGDSEQEIGAGSYEDYLGELQQVWSQCYRKGNDNAILVVNINSRRVKGRFYPIAMDIASSMTDWELWDHNIWYIPNALPQPNAYRERLLDNKFESLLVFKKGDPKGYKFHKPRVPQKYITADPRAEKKNSRGRCLGNILRIPAYRPPNIKKMSYHVAAYPEELVAFLLESYTDEGDTVLDPFLGSGTTLKVSRAMGRQGIGYEVHDDFTNLIKARIDEQWSVPSWTDLDIIHSSSNTAGQSKPRRPKRAERQSEENLEMPFFMPLDE